MKKFAPILILVVLALALVLGSTWIDRGTLHLDGEIDRDFVLEIEDFPKSDLKTIVINSPGGSYRDAIDAANHVLENDIRLVVDGKCFSACASILLPSGSDIEIKSGSIIAFHNMPGFWHYFEEYLRKNEDYSISHFQTFRDSEEVISIYRRAGINPDFFLALAAFHTIKCIGVERGPESGVVNRLQMYTDVEFYIPSEALFKQFGWRFKEANFPDLPQLREVLDEMGQERGPSFIAAARPGSTFPQELIDGGLSIQSVEFCD